MGIVRDTIKYREENNVIRKDFLQLMMDLKSSETGSLTLNEMTAQAFIFFLAGYETSSTTMSFCLFELAKRKEIQDKLRAEITEVLKQHGGEITYEAIMDMKYLQQVLEGKF